LHFRSIGGGLPAGILISGVSAALAAVLIFIFKRERKALLAGAAFFFVGLIPAVIAYTKFSVFAEQWIYLSSFGAFLFISATLVGISTKKGALPAVIAIIFTSTALLSASTREYNLAWMDSSSLSERVLSSSHNDRVALYFKAVNTDKSRDITGALDVMKSTTEKAKSDPVVLYLTGRIALAAGETDEGETNFKRAFSINPGYDNAYLGMAFVSFLRKEDDEGASYLRKTLDIKPNNREALIFLGKYHLAKKELPEALETFKKAERIYPYNHEVILEMGNIHETMGNMPESARYYIKVTRLYPERPEAYYRLGRVFYISGYPDDAMSWVQRSIEADPTYEPALTLIQNVRKNLAI
jgi:tetratricopeptide (TPR) repeat protein